MLASDPTHAHLLVQSALFELACSPPPLGIAALDAAVPGHSGSDAGQTPHWQHAALNLNTYLLCVPIVRLACLCLQPAPDSIAHVCQVPWRSSGHVWAGAPALGVHFRHGCPVW